MANWLYVGGAAVAAFAAALLLRSRMAKGATTTTPAVNKPIASTDAARAKALTSAWTDDDFRTLHAMAGRLKMTSPDLALVLTSESGLKPTAVNRRKGDNFPIAVGLNQLTTAANGAAGITELQRIELLEKPVSFQLPIIERMFSNTAWAKSGKSFDNAAIIYATNFAPSRLVSRGSALSTVLYDKSDGVFYDQNKQLDTAKKGSITIGDLVDYMRKVSTTPTYQAALTRLRAVTGETGLEPRLPTS